MSIKKILAVVLLATAFIVAIGAAVAMVRFQETTRSKHAFRFAWDLVSFHNKHSRLPASTQEFCLWTASSLGYDWDVEKTDAILRFSWTNSVRPGDQLIEFIDPRYAHLQAPVNQYLHAHLALDENHTNEMK